MPQMGPAMWLIICLLSWFILISLSVKPSSLKVSRSKSGQKIPSLIWKW